MEKCMFVFFENRGDAVDTLNNLREIAKTYSSASKADLFDIIGKECSYVDRKVFWTQDMLRKAEVDKITSGWTIIFPKPIDESARSAMHREGYFPSYRYSKRESKPVHITIDTDVNEDITDRLKAVIEQVKTIQDREVFITIT